jgi:plasmid stability protein
MKMTIDLPDSMVKQIKLRAVHDGKKLKDAVADLLRKGLTADRTGSPTNAKADKSMLKRRQALAQKFLSGEWGVELSGFEAAADTDRLQAARRATAFRD